MEMTKSSESTCSDESNEDYSTFHCNMESVTFHCDSHSSNFLKEMKKMYENKLLTDVNLCVDGELICCHRNVLASTSPYFRAMFTLGLKECHHDHIDLYEVDIDSVEQLVNYAYTGSLEISRDNVQSLLAASSLFQIIPVQRACAKFLETQLDNTNSVGIYCFAQAHCCQTLKSKAREHIEKNFTEVCEYDEFLTLSFDKISEIIVSDELNVEQEETVFEAIIRWVQDDENDRQKYLGDLLQHLRFGLLSIKYINGVIAQHRLVKKCNKCKMLLDCWKRYENNPAFYQCQYDFSLSLRTGMIKPEQCLLLIGGAEQEMAINCYNPLTRETFFMENFPSKKFGDYYVEDVGCVVTEKNDLFAGGGNYIYKYELIDHIDSDDSFEELEERMVRKEFFKYDHDYNRWTQLILGGKIYCFGGVTENQHPTEIIEVYDIEKNKWSYQGMLQTTLVDLCSVVYEDHIFLLGGRTGVGAHNLVVMYNPYTGSWLTRSGMPTPRFNFGACVVDNEIYVAGGQIYSHSTHTITRDVLYSVEIFNIAENQWRQGPHLPEGIYNVGLYLVNGALYACGTTENQRFGERRRRRNIVCRLDFGSSHWEIIEDVLSDKTNFCCIAAKLHTRKLSQVFRPEVDT
ncbi:hypothetical protein KUTeg_014009 [Tegillarca granosa]|uniref:BTB domain-containing protein n=1 Tax=Tegillarca granosa TaxID=220873 RepID=A0ABQ9F0I9_TEGGR|nr:hypothetical protein KUTeg_014009 [Tegillarca granosa]